MKKNFVKVFSILAIALTQFSVFGQQIEKAGKSANSVNPNGIIFKSIPNSDGIIRCHTMEMDSIRRANTPGSLSLYQEEMLFQQKMAEFNQNNESKALNYTIPIIFHIFTDGAGADNVSAAIVQNQLDQLNLDYRDMAGSTHPAAGDAGVEFCLALVDENGSILAEPGIERITTYGQGPFSSSDFDNSMKAATIWNPDNYFNVWVASLSGGILGYAQFPDNSGLGGLATNGGAANTDGCVILNSSLGSVANPQGSAGAAFNKGRTLTHEAGHWLGLRHIWGDSNCGNDFCNDTPQSSGSNFGCPTQTTCDGILDMVQNYMDYSDDACMDIFTVDQAARITTVMTVSPRRASLASSTACQSPNPDNAGISNILDASGSLCSTTVTPTLVLTNSGNNTLTSVTIDYDLDGGASTQINWTGNLAAGASENVVLPTLTPGGGAHVLNASTSMPNGNADTDPSNDANSSSFTIVVGGQVITLVINTDCYGEESLWELLDAGTSTVLESGGNQNVTIPVTVTQGTAASDPGAYPSETQITVNWCLTDGCYDFNFWDAYGDGINGSSVSGCSTDGDYTITDGGGTVLAALQAANGAFLFSESSNFCLTSCNSTFTSSTTEELCNGDDNGEITVTFATGNSTGATYDIGNGPIVGGATNTFTGLAQGNYSVTIVDGDGCTSFEQVTLAGPAPMGEGIVVTDISCNGQTDGQITVSTTGGAPTVTYDIGAGPVNSGSFTGLSANSYTVNIIDGNSCTASVSGTVSEPAVLAATTGTISPELFGNDGGITLNVTGGTPTMTYTWTGTGGYSSSAVSPSNMPGGTYDVTVTDSRGCSVTITGIVVPSQLGLDEFGSTQFIIYPNPSTGVFNVQLVDAADGDYTVNVLDIAGRIVYSSSNNVENTFVVDLSDAANGTYMLNIQTDTQILTKRIVLKK